MVTSFWNKTVLSYKVWIFEIDFLSSFRTNSLWKQPVERLIAREHLVERFILKVQGWADADKVTLLFPRKNSACCKGVFSMNKSIFHKGWKHWSILQLYFIWPHSHLRLPTDGFISCRKQWTRLLFIQNQVFFCVNFLHAKTWAVLWTCNMDQDKGPCSSVSVLGSREVGEWWIREQNWILNPGLVIVPSNGENEFAGGVKLKTSMQRGCSVKVVD